MKNPEPRVRQITAPTKRTGANGSDTPFADIYSTALSKLFILLKIDDMNIAEIATLETKSKNNLAVLVFAINFFNLS